MPRPPNPPDKPPTPPSDLRYVLIGSERGGIYRRFDEVPIVPKPDDPLLPLLIICHCDHLATKYAKLDPYFRPLAALQPDVALNHLQGLKIGSSVQRILYSQDNFYVAYFCIFPDDIRLPLGVHRAIRVIWTDWADAYQYLNISKDRRVKYHSSVLACFEYLVNMQQEESAAPEDLAEYLRNLSVAEDRTSALHGRAVADAHTPPAHPELPLPQPQPSTPSTSPPPRSQNRARARIGRTTGDTQEVTTRSVVPPPSDASLEAVHARTHATSMRVPPTDNARLASLTPTRIEREPTHLRRHTRPAATVRFAPTAMVRISSPQASSEDDGSASPIPNSTPPTTSQLAAHDVRHRGATTHQAQTPPTHDTARSATQAVRAARDPPTTAALPAVGAARSATMRFAPTAAARRQSPQTSSESDDFASPIPNSTPPPSPANPRRAVHDMHRRDAGTPQARTPPTRGTARSATQAASAARNLPTATAIRPVTAASPAVGAPAARSATEASPASSATRPTTARNRRIRHISLVIDVSDDEDSYPWPLNEIDVVVAPRDRRPEDEEVPSLGTAVDAHVDIHHYDNDLIRYIFDARAKSEIYPQFKELVVGVGPLDVSDAEWLYTYIKYPADPPTRRRVSQRA